MVDDDKVPSSDGRSRRAYRDRPAFKLGRSSSISDAFLDPSLNRTHDEALMDATDLLVVDEVLREWVVTYVHPYDFSFQLHVRADLGKRRLRKIRNGVICYLPSEWLHEADSKDQMVDVFYVQCSPFTRSGPPTETSPRPHSTCRRRQADLAS